MKKMKRADGGRGPRMGREEKLKNLKRGHGKGQGGWQLGATQTTNDMEQSQREREREGYMI